MVGADDIISATIMMQWKYSPTASGRNQQAITIMDTMANTTQIGTEAHCSTTLSDIMMQETPLSHDHTLMQKECLKEPHQPIEKAIITQHPPLHPLNKRAGTAPA